MPDELRHRPRPMDNTNHLASGLPLTVMQTTEHFSALNQSISATVQRPAPRVHRPLNPQQPALLQQSPVNTTPRQPTPRQHGTAEQITQTSKRKRTDNIPATNKCKRGGAGTPKSCSKCHNSGPGSHKLPKQLNGKQVRVCCWPIDYSKCTPNCKH